MSNPNYGKFTNYNSTVTQGGNGQPFVPYQIHTGGDKILAKDMDENESLIHSLGN